MYNNSNQWCHKRWWCYNSARGYKSIGNEPVASVPLATYFDISICMSGIECSLVWTQRNSRLNLFLTGSPEVLVFITVKRCLKALKEPGGPKVLGGHQRTLQIERPQSPSRSIREAQSLFARTGSCKPQQGSTYLEDSKNSRDLEIFRKLNRESDKGFWVILIRIRESWLSFGILL